MQNCYFMIPWLICSFTNANQKRQNLFKGYLQPHFFLFGISTSISVFLFFFTLLFFTNIYFFYHFNYITFTIFIMYTRWAKDIYLEYVIHDWFRKTTNHSQFSIFALFFLASTCWIWIKPLKNFVNYYLTHVISASHFHE